MFNLCFFIIVGTRRALSAGGFVSSQAIAPTLGMLPLLRSENLSFAKIIMARRCEIQVLKIIKTRIIDNLIKRVPPCDSGSTLHFIKCNILDLIHIDGSFLLSPLQALPQLLLVETQLGEDSLGSESTN